MKVSSAILSAIAVGFCTFTVDSAVIEMRAKITDVEILNYALTLEHLENAFYKSGLKKYTEKEFTTAFSKQFYKQIKRVAADEQTHVDFLTTALKSIKAKPTQPCEYEFPDTDVKSFAAVASVLEGVGVSAYLGAAASIMEKAYLTAAGSILTVEARHSSYIRNVQKQAPFPSPFDAPLSFNEVFSLASAFIKKCPASNPPLPFKAFPALSLSPSSPKTIKSGDTITLKTAADCKGTTVYAAFITVTGPIFAAVKVSGQELMTTVPAGVNGQTYVILTTCKSCAVTDDNTKAGPAIIEITNYEGDF